MLSSVVFEFTADARDAAFRGDQAHACLMDMIRALDPKAADAIHGPLTQSSRVVATGAELDTKAEQPRGHRPFTVWVGPRFHLGPEGVSFYPDDDHCWLRLTGLSDAVSSILARLAKSPPSMVRLGERRCRVSCVFAPPVDHLWVGASTFDELRSRWSRRSVPRSVRLVFLSPTTFKGDAPVRFPEVGLVFKSLLRHWKEYAPPSAQFPDGFEESFLSSVHEDGYEIYTVGPLDLGKDKRRGFVGTCTYSADFGASPSVQSALHVLADFAFYAGVGLKTTMGMGQVLCEEHGPRRKQE